MSNQVMSPETVELVQAAAKMEQVRIGNFYLVNYDREDHAYIPTDVKTRQEACYNTLMGLLAQVGITSVDNVIATTQPTHTYISLAILEDAIWNAGSYKAGDHEDPSFEEGTVAAQLNLALEQLAAITPAKRPTPAPRFSL